MSERFKLIAEGLDVAPLLKKIEAQPHLWKENTMRQSYPGSAHADTETIYLRWARDQSLEGAWFDLTSEDHEETIRTIGVDVLRDVMNAVIRKVFTKADFDNPSTKTLVNMAVDIVVGRVILTKLKPGGTITEHVDEGPYADRYDRFHVVLDGWSTFFIEDDPFTVQPGQLFWFNHKRRHEVRYGSGGAECHYPQVLKSPPRIHLIIDIEAPEYRKLRGLTFQRERAHELLDEARPLFEAHYREISHFQDIPLDINEAAYMHLEESGLLRCFTARYNGELVGYCVFFVKHNPRYQSSLQANQDILYIDKSQRGALFGKRLLEYCHDRLKAEGVQVVYQHTKAARSEGRFMVLLGYELVDYIYAKRLDR